MNEKAPFPSSASALPPVSASPSPVLLSRIIASVVILIYGVGVAFRYLYIFKWNRAMDLRFSDMKGYYEMGQKWCDPDTVWCIADTVVPPGSYWYFGGLMYLDSSMQLYMVVQFILSCLTPVLIALIGWDLFGKRVALLALCIASLYYPLFDYFAYFMTEGPFMMLLLLSIWMLIRSIKSKHQGTPLFGLAGGIVLGLAAALKTVALPGAFLVFLLLIYATWRRRLKRGGLLLVPASIGLILVLIPLAIRGTRLTNDEVNRKEGKFRFCLIANDTTRNILLGHYGRIGGIHFHDKKRGILYGFGSPSAPQSGYTHTVDIDIPVYDQPELLRLALTWIKDHPREALQLSFDHMFDLFFGTYSWPSSSLPQNHPYVKSFAQLFLVFILFPACMHIVLHARDMLRLRPQLFGDFLLTLPLIALLIVAFVSLGEPRYRIPFDGFLILLACRMYCRRVGDTPALIEGASNATVGCPERVVPEAVMSSAPA